MSPERLSKRIEALVGNADAEFEKVVKATQKKIYNKFIAYFKDLELVDGYIKNNSANRKLVQNAGALFDKAISESGYKAGLSQYASHITDISALNAAYFETIKKAFTPNANFLKSLQKQAISQIEKGLNEGLVSTVKSPLMNIINQNINTGGSFSGFLDQLRKFLVGEDKAGELLRYSRTWTSDALFQYSRAYQAAISSDLGLEWYYYSGGAIDKTRAFCKERLDQYWHKKEVEAWALLDWKGKIEETTESSIFVYAGGHNCRHSLIPVSNKIVPQDAKNRLELVDSN